MHFNSFLKFLAMGKHGFFVWLSYGLSFLLLVLLIMFSINYKKQAFKKAKQLNKLNN